MITWLLPAALLLAVVAIVAIGRAPRTDGRRAALILWTGWTVVTGLTFSLMEGTYHDYYVVALAPAIAAGVAVGGTVLWDRKHTWLGRAGLALAVAGSAVWAFVLLGRATGVYESLRWPVLVVGVVAALAPARRPPASPGRRERGARGRPGRRGHRTRGVHAEHRRHAAHRLDRHGRTGAFRERSRRRHPRRVRPGPDRPGRTRHVPRRRHPAAGPGPDRTAGSDRPDRPAPGRRRRHG